MSDGRDVDLNLLSERLRSAVGAARSSADVVTAAAVARLAATLGCDAPARAKGDAIPPGWHCLVCLPQDRADDLNVDGLPRHMHPVPPMPFARRVFGGAQLAFVDDIRIGDEVACEVRLQKIDVKQGKAGPLVIATLECRYETARGLALVETQDVINLSAAPSAAPRAGMKAPAASWSETRVPDEVLLFRYSALTFNSHRIHYDVDYARKAESLPGLVVQGRLLSLLLLESLRRFAPARPVARFDYRSVQPVYCGAPLTIGGAEQEDGIALWAADANGDIAQRGLASS